MKENRNVSKPAATAWSPDTDQHLSWLGRALPGRGPGGPRFLLPVVHSGHPRPPGWIGGLAPLPPLAPQPANSRPKPPPPPGAEWPKSLAKSPPEAQSWRESLLAGSALLARRPTPLSPALQALACCPSPFLTLSSSPPAEAVVTAATNAVVLAAWSTPRPALRPLDPTRRPLGGGKGRRGAEEATEAKLGPEAPGRRGKVRRRAAAAAPPHVHTGHSAPARSCRQPDPQKWPLKLRGLT